LELEVRRLRLSDIDGPAGLLAIRESIANELAEERGGTLFLADRALRTPMSFLDSAPDTSLCEVVLADGALIGWSQTSIRVLSNGSRVATLEEIAVDPAAREIGAGEALLNSAIAWCGEQGCTGVDSYALPGARETKNFFETFGLKARLLTVHLKLDRTESVP